MTLAASGQMSIGGSTASRSINVELGRSPTAQSNLNETSLRTLAAKASGAIALSDFYGKSNGTNHTTSLSDAGPGYCSYSSGLGQTACASDSTVTAIVSNGIGPFTYSWSRIAGTGLSISGSTTGASVLIIHGNDVAGTYSATFRCVVTDTGNGNYQTTTDIAMTHTHEDLG